MKNISFIVVFCLFAFQTKAQELNFEETVKYINSKIKCCAQLGNEIAFSKQGDIDWYHFGTERVKINLFDLAPKVQESGIIIENNGIGFGEDEYQGIYYVCFQISTTKNRWLNKFEIKAEAERVYKALIHLRSLCTKEKDPFDK